MTPRSFAALAAVTAVTVAAAAWSVTAGTPRAVDERAGERFLPDLARTANDVTRIVVTAGGTEYKVARTPEGWVLPDKANFPVRFEAVRDLVGGLAQLTVLEAKTDRQARLELQEPDKPDSPARRVRLERADGSVVADVVLGRADYTVGGAGGLYVRTADTHQAWLVQGRAPLPHDAMGWTDREVVHIPAAQVTSVAASGGQGPAFTLERGADGKPAFAGGAAANASEADRLFALAEHLSVDDVRPADAAPAAGPEVRQMVLRTSDGVRLGLTRFEIDGAPWVRVTAEAEADGARETAAAIAKRTDGFAFRIPTWKAELLAITADKLEPPAS